MKDEIPTKLAYLTQPKNGFYILNIQEEDGTFKRYQVSRNSVCGFVSDGASMAFRHREEMS
jgi:hypothetical protein